MEENNNFYYHEQDFDDNNSPNLDELEDEEILAHITPETLSVSCSLKDDAFSGTQLLNVWTFPSSVCLSLKP